MVCPREGEAGKKSERRHFLFSFWRKSGEKEAASAELFGGGRG